MGLIAKILSFTRVTRNGAQLSDVAVDPGPGNILTAEHVSAPGEDSRPLPNDYAVLIDLNSTGRKISIGYFDLVNAPTAAEGEKRMYGRGSNGSAVSIIWLKNTGDIVINNNNGTLTVKADGEISGANSSGNFKLESGGDFVANGAKMEVGGDVITSDNISLRTHTHIGNLGAPTSAPVPGA